MMSNTTVADVQRKTPAEMTLPDGGLWNSSESDQAVVTETFHRTDLDTLEWSETINDPKMYTQPWETMKLPMRLHNPGTDLMEYYCSPVEAESYNKAFEASASQK